MKSLTSPDAFSSVVTVNDGLVRSLSRIGTVVIIRCEFVAERCKEYVSYDRSNRF